MERSWGGGGVGCYKEGCGCYWGGILRGLEGWSFVGRVYLLMRLVFVFLAGGKMSCEADRFGLYWLRDVIIQGINLPGYTIRFELLFINIVTVFILINTIKTNI